MILETAVRINFVASTSYPYGLKSAKIDPKIFRVRCRNNLTELKMCIANLLSDSLFMLSTIRSLGGHQRV